MAGAAADPYIAAILAEFTAMKDLPWRHTCRPLSEMEERAKAPFTAGQRLWRNITGWDEIGRLLTLADRFSSDPTTLHGYTFYTLLTEIWRHMSDRPQRSQVEMLNALKAVILTSEDVDQTGRIIRLAKVMGALLQLKSVIRPAIQQPPVAEQIANIVGMLAQRAAKQPQPIVMAAPQPVPTETTFDEDPC